MRIETALPRERALQPESGLECFTARETAYLASVSLGKLRTSTLSVRRSQKIACRTNNEICFDQDFIFRLSCLNHIGSQLSSKHRKIMMENLKYPPRNRLVSCGSGIFVQVKPLESEIRSRLATLKHIEKLLEKVINGQRSGFVFLTNRHSIYEIYHAALGKAKIDDDLKRRFPGISDEELQMCRIWAFIHPPRGRRDLLL